ncbi:hypothetical protein MW722_001435 [Acinetobacter baumannii]|uniref:Uncharacterized protein n=3 Tax=Acinetobacter baumannii TaxID=470 RepID=A0AAP1FBQ5_ACIBA|nr:hypothetical protein [Acinetobacter baumannii]EMT94650.1 hypothetical protein ABNIH5_00545 [Acinetobacter baumannii ABNIH5]EMU22237.1 hypothetical protein ABNIH15_02630 [Acinetobacter baumannii ABNIH15]ETY66891.1 hypothetical protein X964_18260 [Acinetobacter baumannii MDR_MMC4]AVE44270.1 hypothetical protein AM435_00515 [Acinetobacter baumannii]AVG28367.1 hypothetical protein C5H40_19165 [Acinetobacter baumannii]
MHFYSETYQSLLAMPIKTFWLLSNSVERIEAQRDLRHLKIALAGSMGATQEGIENLMESLRKEVGEVIKGDNNPILNTERDEAGFEALRNMT